MCLECLWIAATVVILETSASEGIILKLLRSCSPRVLTALKGNMELLGKARPPPFNRVSVGTLCSGTDIVIPALHSFCQIMHKVGWTTSPIQIWLSFSCEIVGFKQKFCKLMTAPFNQHAPLYQDVMSLGQTTQDMEGKMVPVKGADLVFAGFECDDGSFMNPKRSSMLDCVASSCGKTGTTFKGIADYYRSHPCECLVLENVPGLGTCTTSTDMAPKSKRLKREASIASSSDPPSPKTNTDAVMNTLRTNSGQCLSSTISSEDCGSACKRERLFFWGTKPGHEAMDSNCAKEIVQEVANTKVGSLDLASILYAKDDDIVKLWLKNWKRRNYESGDRWRRDYLNTLASMGLKFSTFEALEQAAMLTPYGTSDEDHRKKLTERERVCLMALYLSSPLEDLTDDTKVMCWDLSQSLGRNRYVPGRVPAILPGSVIWIHHGRQQGRIMIPIECCKVQGICFEDFDLVLVPSTSASSSKSASKEYSWREIMHLAGDAYNVYSLSAAIIITFCLWRPSAVPLAVEKGL